MTAVLFVATSFALGLFLGALVAVARDYMDDRADQDAHRDELVAQWRAGFSHGFTTGRVRLLEEQESRSHHPTQHPLAEVRRLFDQGDD